MPGERVRLHLAARRGRSAAGPGAVPGAWWARWPGTGTRPVSSSGPSTPPCRAGATYSRMYAFGDAYAAYSRVLDLVERVPHDLDLAEVRLLAAEAARHVGDPDRARELLELVRGDTDDPHTRALAAERIGACTSCTATARPASGPSPRPSRWCPPGETSVLAARIQGGLALLGVGWSRLDDAELAGTEGLRIARAVGARREEGIALNALGTTAALRGDLGRGVDLLREALEIAREVEDPWDLGAGLRQPQPRPRDGRPARRVRGARPGRDRRADPVRPAAGAGQPAAEQRQRDAGGGRPVRGGRRARRRGAEPAPAGDPGRAAAPPGRAHRHGQRRPDHRLGALRAGPAGARVRDRAGVLDADRRGDRRGGRPVGGTSRGGVRRWWPTA